MPNKRKIRGRKRKKKIVGRESEWWKSMEQRQASVNSKESSLEKKICWKTCSDTESFNAYEGCRRPVASAACNYLPGFTQNKWAAVIGPSYVPLGSFIPNETQSLPPDCFINSSTEYNWHFFNQISLDAWREGNLKKRTQKRVRMIILLNKNCFINKKTNIHCIQ